MKKQTFLVPPQLLKLIIAKPEDKDNEQRLKSVERSRKKVPPWLAVL